MTNKQKDFDTQNKDFDQNQSSQQGVTHTPEIDEKGGSMGTDDIGNKGDVRSEDLDQ